MDRALGDGGYPRDPTGVGELTRPPSIPTQIIRPAPPLRPWCDHFKFGVFSPKEEHEEVVVDIITSPSAMTELVIATRPCMDDHHPSGERVPKPRVFVFGPMSSERGATLRVPARTRLHLLSVMFRPGVFPLLFGESAHAARDQVCDPDTLVRRSRQEALIAVCDDLTELPSASQTVRLEALLCQWTAPLCAKVDPRAAGAFEAIRRSSSAVNITGLAREFGVSTRPSSRSASSRWPTVSRTKPI